MDNRKIKTIPNFETGMYKIKWINYLSLGIVIAVYVLLSMI